MNSNPEGVGNRPCWFVGASYGGTEDNTSRFIDEGIWGNGYEDKYQDEVRSIQPGDRIAIRANYTRKHDLPFDNRGRKVAVMAIKAIGTVTENPGDGRMVKVDWKRLETLREWYFYTFIPQVWKVMPGGRETDALITFTFEGKPQDIDWFRNLPYWREKFGEGAGEDHRFDWTKFYEAVADKLLEYRENRLALVAGIHGIAERLGGFSFLQDRYADGTTGPLKDICPFTTIGIFNRGISDANRKIIAAELAKLLGVTEAVPESFAGIPVVDNRQTWFFSFEKDRQPGDIDALWKIFAEALDLLESDDDEAPSNFIEAYDRACKVKGVAWNLTMGLYWIRPWQFQALDGKSRNYIGGVLKIPISLNGPTKRCTANDYLSLLEGLKARFLEETFPVRSFPELSLAAWQYQGVSPLKPPEDEKPPSTGETPEPIKPYSVDDILVAGSFLERARIEQILERLRTKKNLILQGPPGTGKTWLAKRLAYALVGRRDDGRVRAVQFHPNLSYEDFVRGWRPTGEGKLSLVDGPFLEMVNAAKAHGDSGESAISHVLVIEEINRGNPAQIFGEMLTLLEADKRNQKDALELCYRRGDCEKVFIPDNLYVIGTMNIADRSLAMVDLALRRRFAFVDLEPEIGKTWRDWVHGQFHIDMEILLEIEKRILALNEEIAADASLGRQFRIGHSYVTPPSGVTIANAREWFRQVVKTEISPLLDEYWFDAPEKARQARQKLVEGF